jgi:hypothetical protein
MPLIHIQCHHYNAINVNDKKIDLKIRAHLV